MSTPLLEVRGLRVAFPGQEGLREVVRGISFTVGCEKVGIVGESGSGKSMTARAILDLIPPPGRVSADRLTFAGQDLTRLKPGERTRLRGRRIAMVLQDPRHALNPVMTIGAQLAETFRLHHRLSRGEARRRSIEALDAVHIRDPERVVRLYPHEISGGMGQRAMIAMMLAPGPELLLADEPTSALDATVEAGILETLDELVTARGMGLVLVSHDLDLVAAFCDRVLVFYAGRIVEELPARDLAQARHPYTQGLLACVPRLGERRRELPVLRRDPSWAAS
ncbi:ABC transporter ATP-binding protein [Geminicoccus flavidas]|uniref:ABC transporter ATP-binding protein n=1 Tax=Geminicoccus flavidas TaxID=2506407 RepID=UPI00135B741A|nr:ABC transporter ATP-binding protein [Geminicoccus flavidas]